MAHVFIVFTRLKKARFRLKFSFFSPSEFVCRTKRPTDPDEGARVSLVRYDDDVNDEVFTFGVTGSGRAARVFLLPA